jgi:hypothetical protein
MQSLRVNEGARAAAPPVVASWRAFTTHGETLSDRSRGTHKWIEGWTKILEETTSEPETFASLGLTYRHFLELSFAAAANAVPRLDVSDVADLTVILNFVKFAIVNGIEPLNDEVAVRRNRSHQLELLMKEALILQCAQDVGRLASKFVAFLAALEDWLVTRKHIQTASKYDRHLSSLGGSGNANSRRKKQKKRQHSHQRYPENSRTAALIPEERFFAWTFHFGTSWLAEPHITCPPIEGESGASMGCLLARVPRKFQRPLPHGHGSESSR